MLLTQYFDWKASHSVRILYYSATGKDLFSLNLSLLFGNHWDDLPQTFPSLQTMMTPQKG